jgi:hypothetical protein
MTFAGNNSNNGVTETIFMAGGRIGWLYVWLCL